MNQKGVMILKKILKVEQIQKYYGSKDNVTKAKNPGIKGTRI